MKHEVQEVKEDPEEIALRQEEEHYMKQKPPITISNVVCNYRCRTHLNLRDIALSTKHVIYKRFLYTLSYVELDYKITVETIDKSDFRDQGKIMMKIRKPNMMANIWSSGKIVCQGARSEAEAMKGARR